MLLPLRHEAGILIILDMVVKRWNRDLTVKPYIPEKNEFVKNALRDNMGMIIFDLRGCGGC